MNGRSVLFHFFSGIERRSLLTMGMKEEAVL